MSTLTKILIVLLALFSFGLCGAVVTYVGSAENFKDSYLGQKKANDVLQADNRNMALRFNEKTEQMKQLQDKYNQDMQQLRDEIARIETQFRDSKRVNVEYQGRLDTWSGVVNSFNQTISNLEQSLKLTQQQLDLSRERSIKDQQELNERTSALYEKIVQFQTVEAERRRLLEQNQSLEEQMSRTYGSGAARTAPVVVTPEPGAVKPAAATPAAGDMSGLITEVGTSLVTVSLGSADGVRKDMRFHVTRGSEFVCDIVITDVDINKSAGVLELKTMEPRVGDTVSTRL